MDRAQSGVTKPAAPVTGVTTAYPLTEAAFIDLIGVETLTGMLADELDRCERSFSDRSSLPDGFWYIAILDDDMPEDLRALRAARRVDRPPEFDPYWRWLDDYHRVRARWRCALRKARASVDAAIVETDYATTPPLDRPSAKILRVIQALHMSLPDPMWLGDSPPIGRSCSAALRAKVPEISAFVEELRILRDSTVLPTRSGPDDGNAKALDKEARKRGARLARLVGPGSDGLLVLQFMTRELIKERQDAMKASALVRAALGRERKRSDTDLFVDLAEEGFLHSTTGARGGYWVTGEGAVLATRHSD